MELTETQKHMEERKEEELKEFSERLDYYIEHYEELLVDPGKNNPENEEELCKMIEKEYKKLVLNIPDGSIEFSLLQKKIAELSEKRPDMEILHDLAELSQDDIINEAYKEKSISELTEKVKETVHDFEVELQKQPQERDQERIKEYTDELLSKMSQLEAYKGRIDGYELLRGQIEELIKKSDNLTEEEKQEMADELENSSPKL